MASYPDLDDVGGRGGVGTVNWQAVEQLVAGVAQQSACSEQLLQLLKQRLRSDSLLVALNTLTVSVCKGAGKLQSGWCSLGAQGPRFQWRLPLHGAQSMRLWLVTPACHHTHAARCCKPSPSTRMARCTTSWPAARP